jgi:hypothetical protein
LAQNTSRLGNLQVDVKIDFGAKGTGTDDDATAVQNAINAVASLGGGVVWFPFATYLLNSPITLKSGVFLRSCGAQGGVGGATLQAGHSGIMFQDASSGYCASGIEGLVIKGKSDQSTLNGVVINSQSCIRHANFNNFSQSAILLNGTSIACTLEDITSINAVANRSVASPTGGVHVLGTDHFIHTIESNVQTGHTDVTANGNAVSLYIGGTNQFVTDCIGEYGEIGIYIASNKSRIKGCRADRNMGHGFVVTGTTNTFSNCHAIDNGSATANTYTAFQVQGNLNIVIGCLVNQSGNTLKYGFDDQISSATQKNEYFGCNVIGSVGTAKFNNTSNLGSGFVFGNGWYQVTSGTTVDVSGINNLYLNYSSTTTITAFTGGVNGQQIKIVGNTKVTLQYGTSIKNIEGNNKTLDLNRVYTFTNLNGVWYEHNGSTLSNGYWNTSIGGGATTYTVTGLTMPDTNYAVNVSPSWNTSWWITSKTATGCTVNFGTAPVSASPCDITLRR